MVNIFIDESGTFAKTPNGFSPSVLGALVIPQSSLNKVFEEYWKLRSRLPKIVDEVKGRLLEEQAVASVIELLRQNAVIYEAVIVETEFHTDEELELHRRQTAEGMVAKLTEKHHQNVVESSHRLRSELLAMPDQQYLQAMATYVLVAKVISHSTLYFSQRIPKELSAFNWVVDAKERNSTTNWEKWWTQTILPWLQSYSIREPMPFLKGADYSWFSRFEINTPEYLTEHFSKDLLGQKGIDLRLLMTENFRFSANIEPGLELVDIVTNALRRALVGNLKSSGWGNLPEIMIHEKKPCLHFLGFSSSNQRSPPYIEIVRQFGRGRRSMLAPRVHQV